MRICPYCSTNNCEYDLLCKSCLRVLHTSPDIIESKKARLDKKKEKKIISAREKKENQLLQEEQWVQRAIARNKTRAERKRKIIAGIVQKIETNAFFIFAVFVRIFAITDYFTIYSSNTLTKNILIVAAMLFPLIGDLFSNFFVLISPISILNNQNLVLAQIITLIIVFVLYIITAAVFLYTFFLSEVKHKKAITSIFVALLVVYISIVSVIRFNFKTIANNELPSQEGTIHLNTMTSYVSPGENAYISIKALPNTEYSISVEYSSGYSTADGLYTKTSDTNGFVRWNWEVGTRTSSGTYPITITDCNSPFYSETFYFTVN